jgi:hypothetical protein
MSSNNAQQRVIRFDRRQDESPAAVYDLVHRLRRQPTEQITSGPQIAGGPRGGDEVLDGADRKRE